MFRRLALPLIGLLIALSAPASAQSPDADAVIRQPLMLVASPRLSDPVYHHTVLLAVPVEGQRHIGFIINRPTDQPLARLFPSHEASKQAVDPVFFGGPTAINALFALVRTTRDPGNGSIGVLDDLYIALHVEVIDRVIEQTPNDARYFIGIVQWQPGELREELRQGMWAVKNPDHDVIFRKDPAGLWKELSTPAGMLIALLAQPDPRKS